MRTVIGASVVACLVALACGCGSSSNDGSSNTLSDTKGADKSTTTSDTDASGGSNADAATHPEADAGSTRTSNADASGSSTPDSSAPYVPTTDWAAWGGWSVGAGSATAACPAGGNVVQATPSNFQSVVTASHSGDTIQFAAGTYSTSSAISFPAGRCYEGASGAIIKWTGSSGGNSYALSISANTAVIGFTFDGAGIQVADNSSDVHITANSFAPNQSEGIYTGAGITDSSISHNTFTQCASACIYGYSPTRSDFSYNDIDGNHGDGMHFTWFENASSPANNVTITHNSFHNTYHYCLELQNNPNGLDIGFNWCGNGLAAHDAFSIATGENQGVNSTNIAIHDNVLEASPNDSSGHNGIAIEQFGYSTVVSYNLFVGHFYPNNGSPSTGEVITWADDTEPGTSSSTPNPSSGCGFFNNTVVDSKASESTSWTTVIQYEPQPSPNVFTILPKNIHDNKIVADGAVATPTMPKVE